MQHYILDESGSPVVEPDLHKWASWFQSSDRIVAKTNLPDGKRVSTVFLSLDHNFGENGPPVLFETMVFPSDSMSELYEDRYCTRAEALEGHAKAVALFSTPEFWA